MSKALIVANWKMHLNPHEASLYMHKLTERIPKYRDVEVVLCPPLLALQSLSLQEGHGHFKLGAQNAYWRDEGPYTGEVSVTMLRGAAKYLIVGHSERRHIFFESDKETRAKVQAAIRNNIQPILCVGETAAERADGETHQVIHAQVTAGLANVTSEELDEVVIAYEPVWALSSSKDRRDPTADEVAEVVVYIRKQVKGLFGAKAAEAIRILYGGNVNINNVRAHLAVPGINGALVGSASLKAEAFSDIVVAAHERQSLLNKTKK